MNQLELVVDHATNVTFENCTMRVAGNDPRPWLAVRP